jgi:hypothetical protein
LITGIPLTDLLKQPTDSEISIVHDPPADGSGIGIETVTASGSDM